MSHPLLHLQSVTVTHRARPALSEVDWRWERGQQWACLGPNGSGKTTLARVLTGQARLSSGTAEMAPEVVAGGIAYVCFEQQQALCQRDDKLDDSEFRPDASDPGTTVRDAMVAGGGDAARLAPWASRLGVAHILDRGLRYISTGEMRKTLLIRAVISDPGLLILDNPLDGLDRAGQREMHAILAELLRGGLPVILLLRQARDIPEDVSHVLVLDDGRLLAQGTRETVLADPALDRLLNPPLPTLGTLPPPAPRPYTLPPEAPLFELRDVKVSYGDVAVLRDVNWTFRRGQHCCIAGPNGCGKTTLLSLVTADNHKAYSQDITLFGTRRGSGESIWDIKEKFGQLDTQLHLRFNARQSALDAVLSGFFDSIGLYDRPGDRQRDIARQWLAALGLHDIGAQALGTLSFGLQRMVLLARAMVKSPVVLILDEPALGLDDHHRRLLLRAIDHIAARSDTQIVYVSHTLGEMPACINQFLEFEPVEEGFRLLQRDA